MAHQPARMWNETVTSGVAAIEGLLAEDINLGYQLM
jgi:hypothetical protein